MSRLRISSRKGGTSPNYQRLIFSGMQLEEALLVLSTTPRVINQPSLSWRAHDLNNEHAYNYEQSHSHPLFGHSHSHGSEPHMHDAEQIVAVFKSFGDFEDTLHPMVLYLHSASLLADAGHSLSAPFFPPSPDLRGDFRHDALLDALIENTTGDLPLRCRNLKLETVSLLRTGDALGIGLHSCRLLIVALSETAGTLSRGHLQEHLHFISPRHLRSQPTLNTSIQTASTPSSSQTDSF
ncbi:hypothetical protein D9619_010614 [Psilocybe cf. subviscida]|uniref:Uncharacterized protein n=1 Tax=Psilocybe cf. subviscida TaxID=2480587 RepID=A0A8H5B8S9_9AGAR|nr:hypothetical protein D9619_010614 [Psilocybe cf. subviscida]